MAVVALTATKRGTSGVAAGHGLAAAVHVLQGTVEVGAADSATSTYDFGNIPSNARITGFSRIWWDDLASAGSPTIDIGLYAVRSNITSDADALNDGLDAASANTTTGLAVVKDIANYGKKAWEFVNGQTTDPGGELTVKASLQDADVNVGGTLTLCILYYLDD